MMGQMIFPYCLRFDPLLDLTHVSLNIIKDNSFSSIRSYISSSCYKGKDRPRNVKNVLCFFHSSQRQQETSSLLLKDNGSHSICVSNKSLECSVMPVLYEFRTIDSSHIGKPSPFESDMSS
ncbi:unnamed protein product [Orchesella dallaii]|uniref:Uncharacterized protein n=1 Tax=Orchesella dallaii TaxID=48710 RepID=A0ABP1PU77_9HEXA